jgi:predicted dehydrogenase
VTLRVGIAGGGMIAGGPVREGKPIATNHAAACRDVDGVALVAFAEPNDERRQKFAEFWKVPAHADVGEMLAREKLDILVVATPPETHESICLAGIEARVPGLLCEKPFTGTAAGARRIVEACRASDTRLAVNFVRRWDEGHQRLAARIADGAIGTFKKAWGCYTGTIRGNGSHLLDTLRMMTRSELTPEWVTPLDADDGPVSAVLASNDARAFITVVESEYFVFELHVYGTKGRAKLLMQGLDLRLDLPESDPDFPGYRYLTGSEEVANGTLMHAFPRCLGSLAAAVRERRPLTPAPADFLASLELLDAVVAKANTSQQRHSS